MTKDKKNNKKKIKKASTLIGKFLLDIVKALFIYLIKNFLNL
ncbi:hypothetical protein [Vallitalea pronyensis]|nr:hypothetical protein [Vallitalea pronyensis]